MDLSTKARPMMEELKKGQWPSFINEIEKSAGEGNEMSNELLDLLEESYERKVPLWKHGGIVGVRGYGGGVVGRYTLEPEKYPAVKEFHTMRINQPSGFFYTSDDIRTLCDIWEKHGSGLTNMHGTTGDAVFLGTTTDHLQPCFNDLSDAGWDLGGSGSNLRTPCCCVGPARCEYSCIDTLDFCYNITQTYQMELHRPMWPYKSKIKISGCPNDCVSSTARSDIAVIGTWRDAIQIDQGEVKAYADAGFPIEGGVVKACPTQCMKFDQDSKELTIDNANCNRCMNCINAMPKALKVGKEKGCSILLGGKATIVQSAFLGWVVVPFMKLDKENDYENFKEFVEGVWDWWDENAKTRERLGELIYRLGMNSMLKSIDMKPVPQMVHHPRENPYIYWYGDDFNKESEVAE